MTGACPTKTRCAGCGIPLSDGYTIRDVNHHDPLDCHACVERRGQRRRRGATFSPTGYAGELIDNTTGRIVAAA